MAKYTFVCLVWFICEGYGGGLVSVCFPFSHFCGSLFIDDAEVFTVGLFKPNFFGTRTVSKAMA